MKKLVTESLNESQDILSLKDLAEIGSRTQQSDQQELAQRVFTKCYIRAYKNKGDEGVQELFKQQTDLDLEVMSHGKYMVV